MIKLNLTPQNKQEELILNYLQNNASESLADKINNGTPFEKDGHPLLNKKTLSGFMKYACDEARKLAEKGANSACIDDVTVYGWAIHFFEEDSIEGTLYTIDGEEYKPAPKKVATTKPVTVKPQPLKPQNLQFSIFDKIDDTEVKDTKTDTLTVETDTDDEEFTEEEKLDAMRQIAEKEQSQTNILPIEQKGNPTYQKYTAYQAEYPTAIVAYRLGDFYEVLGDKAVLLGNELDLTITSRDVGLKERIPMVGFPYHAAENYFAKIVKYHDLYRHGNEVFTNMYPQIVPTEIYENVRRKTETNKYGTRSVKVVYLLRNKIKCGYCGSPISAECGTAKNGQKIRYYKCLGRKHQSGCKKSQVRKEILEKYVLDNVCEQMQRPEILDKMATYLLQMQENRIKQNSVLTNLTKEKRQTENTINNIMQAIELGGQSATVMKRMRELEEKLTDVEKRLTIEKSQTAFRLSKEQIIDYYKSALEKEPLQLINYFIKEIQLYAVIIFIHLY